MNSKTESKSEQEGEGDERAEALAQASKVIAALSASNNPLSEGTGGSEMERHDLESFNLLGVVTNPYMAASVASMPSSSHGYSSRHPTHHHTSSSSDLSSSSVLADLPSLDISSVISPQLEETLQSATDKIDNLNAIFDYYSRHYLGTLYNEDDYYSSQSAHGHHLMLSTSHHDYNPELAHNEQPSSLLPELPPELSSLDLSSVEDHLRTCGGLSANFLQRYEADLEEQKIKKERADKKKNLLKAAPPPAVEGSDHEDGDADDHYHEEDEEMEQVDLVDKN